MPNADRKYLGMTTRQLGLVIGMALLNCLVACGLIWMMQSTASQIETIPTAPPTVTPTPTATPIPTWTPTPTSTPLPSPTPTPTPLDPDAAWAVFQSFLTALQDQDIEAANALLLNPIGFEACLAEESEENCLALVDLMYEMIADFDREAMIYVWADDKQIIMSSDPVAEEEAETTSYTINYVYFIQHPEGEIRLVAATSKMWSTSSGTAGSLSLQQRVKDEDRDGLADYDEGCPTATACIPTDPDKRDTDEDGYWDGIEVAANSDPTDASATPIAR